MRLCPACSSLAVEFIPEASGDVCTECGYTVDVVLLDGSKDIADGHGLSLWQDGMATVLKPITRGTRAGAGWLAQGQDGENDKLLREQNQLRDMQRFIKGTLAHLDRQRYADRAFGLFDVVRRGALARSKQIQEFWKSHEAQVAALDAGMNDDDEEGADVRPTRRKPARLFNWGWKAKGLALACIYATIATSERDTTVSLQQVIHSAGEETVSDDETKRNELSFRKVVKRLRLVRQFGGPTYANVGEDGPRFYLSSMIDFFEALSEVGGQADDSDAPTTRKGKERARDQDYGDTDVDGEENNIVLPISEEVREFLDHVRIPRARTLALQLARALEEVGYVPGPNRTLSGGGDGVGEPTARESAMHVHITAYAIVLWAMEASGRTAGPQLALIALHEYSLRGKDGVDLLIKRNALPSASSPPPRDGSDHDISDGAEGEGNDEGEGDADANANTNAIDDDVRITDSRSTIQLRYSEIRKVLNDSAKHIPWVLSASILASGRRRKQPVKTPKAKGAPVAAAAATLDMSRLDIVRWMPDILLFRNAATKRKESHDIGKDALSPIASDVQSRTGNQARQTENGSSRTSTSDAVITYSAPPPPTDSEAVSRFKHRLESYFLTDPVDLDNLDQEEDTEFDMDKLLFDEDEDPNEIYIRSTPERMIVEQAMRDDGRWEADVDRERGREQKDKARAEREEKRKPKYSISKFAAASGSHSSSSGGGKRTRAEETERWRKRGKPAATGARGGDGRRPGSINDMDWARPLDLSLQTEGWSESSDDDEEEDEEDSEGSSS
ncbi:unnamed protein product [Tilletia laevis]|uniref:TFIIB-type domain-containing protein n=2 Tax=Tilletia TaxID=13289 RepID=A0A177VD69_9BASI|nr:hypothetical protein CF336_g3737 [Tilletia laevis]KAE8261760.1 hypothetical protein A4X03_0g2988 [Tilletia caries]CAD6984935.1 unnamed protein product [Tilletia controversa]KAE8203331.1 hypothetical protein CF335_g3070 [Tilletia laevis]CAD6896536.1 unnamed protein product [Tilletia laevis]